MHPRASRAGPTRPLGLPGPLATRAGPVSWWAPGWTILTAVATGVQGCLVWRLLAHGPASGTTAVLVSVVSVVAVMVGLVAWQPGRGSTARRARPPVTVDALRLAPPVAGVLGLLTLVGLAGSGRALPLPATLALWVSLGLAAVSAGRSWRRLSRGREPTRAELVLPGLLLVAVLVSLTLLEPPQAYAVHITNVAAAAGFVGLAVIPAAAIGETSSGVGTLQGHATRVHRLTERRPVLGLVVVLAKVALVVLVVAAARWLDPGTEVLPSNGRIWVAMTVVGLLALSVLVVEQRLGVTLADHRSLVRGPGLLIGAGIGALAGAAALVIVADVFSSAPVPAACTTALVVGCAALGRHGPPRFGWWGYLVALVAGVVGAVVGRNHGRASFPAEQEWLTHVGLPALVVVAGATSAAVVLAVRAGRTRRRRLLLLAGAVVVWGALISVSGRFTHGWTVLDLDLALAAILLVAWVTWRCGWQNRMDGFEIVVAAVVTTLVLEPFVIMDRLVGELVPVALALVAIGPGVLASVRLWVRARRPGATKRWSDVGRSTTLYGLLLAVVGLTGATSADMLDKISSSSTTFLLLPLALLLLSATSASRRVPGAGG